MRSAILNISLLIALSLSADLSAHGGGTNSYGCHNQSSTGTHHCHSGDYNGLSFSSQDAFLAYVKEQSEQVSQIERDALVALYNSTDGANWRDNTGWLGEAGTECSWFGVECDIRNVLIGLSLRYNALRGTMPSELGNLTNLTYLILSYNSLSGSIPTSLGNLTNLTSLSLAHNKLTGPLPQWLSDMSISGGANIAYAFDTTSIDTTEVTGASTYNRDDYLPAWGDDDGDCINTRHEVLIIESLVPVTMNDSGCLVSTGEWYDPITGQTFTESSDVDIDHHVALSEAHRSGADVWPSEEKKAFANDLLNSFSLQAMDDSTNSSKSDKDPANWLPPNESHHCDYIKNWVEVKSLYNLTYDDAEKVAIEGILGTTTDYGARKSVTGLLASTAAPTGRFSLGITNGTSCGYSSAGSVFTSTLIDFSITPASDHLNQTVDIIIVAVLGSDIYSISDKLQLIPYTGDATKLAAFIPSTTFQESRQFEFIQAIFNDPLSVSLYLAYRLESGDLVYSSEPFAIAVK